MKRVIKLPCIEAARLLRFCRFVNNFCFGTKLPEIADNYLLFVVEENCYDMLREVIEKSVEPLTDHVVLLLLLPLTVNTLEIVNVVHDIKVRSVRKKHIEY